MRSLRFYSEKWDALVEPATDRFRRNKPIGHAGALNKAKWPVKYTICSLKGTATHSRVLG